MKMQRRRILAAMFFIAILCGCSSKSICQFEGCNEPVDRDEKYCITHVCSYCDDMNDGETRYCAKHRCKYEGVFGQCENGIIGVERDPSIIYCRDHRDLDLDRFREAEEIAFDWNWSVAAEARDKLFPPFSFTGDFDVRGNTYYFDVYDSDYGKSGYIIVDDINGVLKCNGVLYGHRVGE